MGTSVTESLRQATVVMKNEIKKFFSGKRMRVFAVLLIVLILVISVAPYLVGGKAKPVYFIVLANFVVIIAATLFASITIVSEYEERTALIVFTRPIRKSSIFIGKLFACYIVTVAFTALYYIVAAIVGQIVVGSVESGLWTSLGMACVYAVATTGIAMLVSSVMKKASTSTIITFVVLIVIFSALSTVLGAAKVDVSWILDTAAGSIQTSSAAYRDMANEMISGIAKIIANPALFINFNVYATALNIPGLTPDILLNVMKDSGAWNATPIADIIGANKVVEPDYLHDVITMLVWGAISLAAAFVMFIKREF